MSRKNLLSSFTERKLTAVNSANAEVTPPPALERSRNRGAFGAITRSIDELAEKAQAAQEFETRLLSGSAVVDLDPEIVDASFVADRMGEDEQAFGDLLEAIRERGQETPILVRPHPDAQGRYMIIFGHRRHRVATALGRKVRAVIKEMEGRDHVIAQGQENSARSDLSFIEKAVFASNLEGRGYDRDVIMRALLIDKTVVSKMISVVKDIPGDIVEAIGAARNSGRDRWYKLAIKFRDSDTAQSAADLINSAEFKSVDSDKRLEMLTTGLEKPATTRLKKAATPKPWASNDKSLSVTVRPRTKGISLEITKSEATPFASWISSNLDSLYEAYRKSKKEN